MGPPYELVHQISRFTAFLRTQWAILFRFSSKGTIRLFLTGVQELEKRWFCKSMWNQSITRSYNNFLWGPPMSLYTKLVGLLPASEHSEQYFSDFLLKEILGCFWLVSRSWRKHGFVKVFTWNPLFIRSYNNFLWDHPMSLFSKLVGLLPSLEHSVLYFSVLLQKNLLGYIWMISRNRRKIYL